MRPFSRNGTPPGHQRNFVWRSLQFILQNVFAFWLEYRVRGLENLPTGPALLIANHQSFLDPLLVGLALAPADGRTTWRLIRDRVARAIDMLLSFGSDASFSPRRA